MGLARFYLAVGKEVPFGARNQDALGLSMSLNMLVGASGGVGHTGTDCRNWMEETGFRDIR
uniref:Uncharacterized protein n=1 Tax=Candidatus Kentrum sp. FW TaxID=2126338 RepID=A0A450SQ82_9GAMM|nr:MAG: hypothetical protein BECKFW1821B_GA0114236_10267 [Candidatus Kentron sp. FW]